jgi:hypothetical protein
MLITGALCFRRMFAYYDSKAWMNNSARRDGSDHNRPDFCQ